MRGVVALWFVTCFFLATLATPRRADGAHSFEAFRNPDYDRSSGGALVRISECRISARDN
jgi:hypothetical protein